MIKLLVGLLLLVWISAALAQDHEQTQIIIFGGTSSASGSAPGGCNGTLDLSTGCAIPGIFG